MADLTRCLAVTLVTFAACPSNALGQVDPISTDRPDFSEGVVTVAPGRLQVESGYTFSRRGDAEQHAAGELLLRIGVLKRAELRIGLNSFAWSEGGGARGFEDLFLGAKLGLHEASKRDPLVPSVALLVGSTLPTGAEAIGEDGARPEAKLALAWDVGERLSLASNLNVAASSDDGERFGQFSASVALGVGITERLGGYIELFGFSPESPDGPDTVFLNGGFTFLATSDLQLDARAGLGFSDVDPDYFLGAGIAWRR